MKTLSELATEFNNLVPAEAVEQGKRLDEMDQKLMRGTLAERFMAREEVEKFLAEATALFGYFSAKYHMWKTIRENLENAKYMDVKTQTVASGDKFVSAAAEREGKAEANGARALESFFESGWERCMEYINTAKRLLRGEENDRRHDR